MTICWTTKTTISAAETLERAGARPEPSRDCALCPRLEHFRLGQRSIHPDWHNAPVPSFGPADAPLLIVGLAPGLQGANRTGRPFTGDFAGDVLYPVLIARGLAHGRFEARPDDGLELTGCRITNAVRCVPPQNKPTGEEIGHCRSYLSGEILGGARPRVIFALGRIAHESVVRTLGLPIRAYPFGHAQRHEPPDQPVLVACYHTSRYNVNTTVLRSGPSVPRFPGRP
jgi:uracil-DNA glycosylase family 4